MRTSSTISLAFTLTLLASACGIGAKAPIPDAGGAAAESPLPAGWREPMRAALWPARPDIGGGQRGPRPQWDAPLWGVPDVTAPSARDCRRPPQTREWPGGSPEGWSGSPMPAGLLRREAAPSMDAPAERKSDALAKAAPGSLSAGRDREPSAAESAARDRAERSDKVTVFGGATTSAAAQQPSLSASVTAGVVDDNADFSEYLAYIGRRGELGLRERDVSERYRVEVRDAHDRPVPDAEVALSWPGARSGLVWARTDAGGSAWLHPRAIVAPEVLASLGQLQLMARAPAAAAFDDSAPPIARSVLQRGQKEAGTLHLPGPAQTHGARPALDLVFLMDATGSMDDEIAKLKASVRDIAAQIARLPGQPDLCLGLVAYRDRGDQFLVRRHDLTNDLSAFQAVLGRLRADGGGDEPEALDEALKIAVDSIAWRGPGTTRLVVLIADAPPHLDRGGPYYDETAAAALARGIKLHAVGASGLNPQGEGVFRQIAQGSGGRFVFLTYRDAGDPGSGPGGETVHDVHSYSVQTLDRLIVRLVKEELALRAM